MKSINEIMSAEDITHIRIYSRYAILMPIKLEDTIDYLGFDSANSEALTPESFNALFNNINNNGRYWNSTVGAKFEERLNAMTGLGDKHYQNLVDALAYLEEQLGKSHSRRAPRSEVDVEKILHNCWWDLIYEESKNSIATENLQVFREQLAEYSIDVVKKLGFVEQIQDAKVKFALFRLKDDFDGIVTFSTDAENGTAALWAQWTSLSGSSTVVCIN